MSSVEERNEVAIVAIRGIGSSSAYRPPERVEAAFCELRLYGVLRSSPERLSCVQSAPCPSGPGLCRILQANFAEFPFHALGGIRAIRRTGASRPHPPSLPRRGPACARGASSLLLWSCASYLTHTTSLTFSVRGFSSLALLRSCSSCRWRASSSISLLSVILRASSSSSRSFFVEHSGARLLPFKRRLPWPLTNAYPMVWEAKQEDP